MSKSHDHKKLKLNREPLRRLSVSELERAAGGTQVGATTWSRYCPTWDCKTKTKPGSDDTNSWGCDPGKNDTFH